MPWRVRGWRGTRVSMLVCVLRFPVGSAGRRAAGACPSGRAGAALPRHELAALDLDRQAAERVDRVWTESVVLREPFGDDQRHGSALEAGRTALARVLPATRRQADDDFLALFEATVEDLGRAAVG